MPVKIFNVAADTNDQSISQGPYGVAGIFPAITSGLTAQLAPHAFTPSSRTVGNAFVRFPVELETDAVIQQAVLRVKPETITNPQSLNVNGSWYDFGAALGIEDLTNLYPSDAFTRQISGLAVGVYAEIILQNLQNMPRSGFAAFRLAIAEPVKPVNLVSSHLISFFSFAAGANNAAQLVVSYALVKQPTNMKPTNMQIIDSTVEQIFRWVYSEGSVPPIPQGGYTVQYRVLGQSEWLSIVQASGVPQHKFNAGFFTVGQVYEWRVAARDIDGFYGAFSQVSRFVAGSHVGAPVVTQPVGIISTPLPLVVWTGAANQDRFIAQVFKGDIFDYETDVILQTAKQWQITQMLEDEKLYRIGISAGNSSGVWSDYAFTEFETLLTKPNQPTIEIAPQAYSVKVRIEQPAPGAGQPAVQYLKLWRQGEDEKTPTLVRSNIPVNENGSYTIVEDWFARSGKVERYFAEAIGVNNAPRESTKKSARVEWDGYILFLASNPSEWVRLEAFDPTASELWTPEVVSNKVLGRKHKVFDVGEHEDEEFNSSFSLLSGEQWDKYNAIVRQVKTVCLKTPRGGRYTGIITSIPREIDFIGDSMKITLHLERDDFQEGK